MSIKERVFKKESLDRYLAEDRKFNKTLSAKDLISMGIGAVIGTGISSCLELLPLFTVGQRSRSPL